MSRVAEALFWGGVLFFCAVGVPGSGLAAQTRPPLVWVEAGRAVPVAAEGRVLPLDTWAQVVYARVSGRDQDPGALEWFLTLLAFPERLEDQPVFLVKGKGLVTPRSLAEQFGTADDLAQKFAEDPTPEGKEALRSARALILYRNLRATFHFEDPSSLASPLASLFPPSGALNPAQALTRPALPPDQKDRLALLLYWHEQSRAGRWSEAASALGLFAGHSADLELLHNVVPWSGIMATFAALALLLAWIFRRPPRWLPALPGMAWLTVTLWLIVRMVISGRPPVTNLASTFLLVSWLSLSLALVLSFRPTQRMTASVALAAGAVLPFLATAFQAGSDPFSPLQAVLNTNFWLALHVTAIVSGYAATLVAGLIGHAYLGVAGNKKGGGNLYPLWRNLRWALVAGLALTLAGTLLGGVWADQSWGRFWGWDPKENGALLIVLWLALVLHLKPSGLTQEWGTAVASALALPVLLFSWMGVNLLGQGFHSYGFAPDKALVFFGILAADALILSFLILRKVLR